ncbi:hypothetical protein P7C70_g989, partial [Phenoliferia sp. Uapishka_3]
MSKPALSSGIELDTYPSPPTSRRASPALEDKDPDELERQTSRRIAHSYPFVLPSQRGALGAFGEREGEEKDPLLLRKFIQEDGVPIKRSKKLRNFYEDQNERIGSLLKPLARHAQDAEDADKANKLPVKIAIWASLAANITLAILQIYAAVSSLSLSFFASAIDAAVMAGASVILIVESIQEMATHKSSDHEKFHLPSTIIVAIAVVVKFGLFLYCYRVRHFGPACRVLYEDHRNDLALNSFALITNALGAKIRWWIDPAGAIILSCILIYLWGSSALMELNCLAGIGAPKDIQELVIYKAMTFSDTVVQIDSCKVFHSGTNYVVELDVVMPPETPLHIAHDLSQVLQDQLETLPSVDRCYVHIDHETSHSPEHRKFV